MKEKPKMTRIKTVSELVSVMDKLKISKRHIDKTRRDFTDLFSLSSKLNSIVLMDSSPGFLSYTNDVLIHTFSMPVGTFGIENIRVLFKRDNGWYVSVVPIFEGLKDRELPKDDVFVKNQIKQCVKKFKEIVVLLMKSDSMDKFVRLLTDMDED